MSTFCYPQPREGILFTGGLGGIETPQDSKLLSTLQIDLQDAQVCVVYEQQELLCKQLPFLLTEAKKRKKEAKKTFSLEKKITTLQEKYDLRRDKYTVQSKNFKTKESSYLARARVLRSDVHLEHQSATAYRSLFFLLKNELI
ncbi:MAG: hypothetical protein Q8O99_06635 [bacterium]|nr:hypothetical protein [bacterium]